METGKHISNPLPTSTEFLSYLWGMETLGYECEYVGWEKFLSYLWGMETLVLQVYQMGVNLFLSYLWGMETLFNCFLCFFIFRSYPTYEEWKLGPVRGVCVKIQSSYPTYEEWKHWRACTNPYSGLWFLSYLWGMETILFKNTVVKIFIHVLILPMRNGNMK